MGIKEAAIYLDNQWNTYYAGQTVNGRIEYVFDSPKKVRGIHVKFKGEAHTEWSESKQEEDSEGKTQSNDTMHTGNEEYFQISYYLLGSSTGNEIEIPAGKQVYNFQCSLPPVLPSSFEGEHGYIRYTVKVVLDRPWKFDQETKLTFTVINSLDLNLNPSYKKPIHLQMEKTFCCLFCASAPLSVDVRAPVTGYCPGQAIPVEVDVDNKSNVQVHLVKVFLRKIVTYRVTSPGSATRKTKDVVVTIQEGPAPAGSSKHYSMRLEVPPVPPSNLVNCNIIDLDYDLKVECVVSGMHCNMKDKQYVTIGTVPLLAAGGPPVSPPAGPQPAVLPVPHPAAPSAPPADAGGWALPGAPLYPTLPDPVYREGSNPARPLAERGDTSHPSSGGPAVFAPYYPTYTMPPLPQ